MECSCSRLNHKCAKMWGKSAMLITLRVKKRPLKTVAITVSTKWLNIGQAKPEYKSGKGKDDVGKQ